MVFIKWSKASFCSSDQFYKQKFRNSISFSLSRPALLCLVVIEISNTKKLACTSSNLNFRIPWGKCKLHVVVSLLKIPLCGLHYFQCDVWVTTTKCPRSIYYDPPPPFLQMWLWKGPHFKFVPEDTFRGGWLKTTLLNGTLLYFIDHNSFYSPLWLFFKLLPADEYLK